MSHSEAWYVVKQPDGHCEIVQDGNSQASQAEMHPSSHANSGEQWGPYPSQSEAIARRVGLIRAGKCQPI